MTEAASVVCINDFVGLSPNRRRHLTQDHTPAPRSVFGQALSVYPLLLPFPLFGILRAAFPGDVMLSTTHHVRRKQYNSLAALVTAHNQIKIKRLVATSKNKSKSPWPFPYRY
jgi:hypothetical protein